MNKTETGKMLMTLRAVWSGEEITPEKIDVYHRLLERYPFADVMRACMAHMSNSTFFPKPAELLKFLAESDAPPISAGEGWEQVQRQINRHGVSGFADATFEHPAVAEAVRAVGWKRLCLEETKYIVPEFNKALSSAQERMKRDAQAGMAPLEPGNVIPLPDRNAS